MAGTGSRAVCAAALLAALAGCAGIGSGTRVYNARYDIVYSASEVRAAGGFMPVQIFGTPPDGASPEEVAASMALPGRFRNIPAEPTRDGSARRIVLAFFQATGERLCAGPGGASGGENGGAPPPGDGSETLRASAAFCLGDRMLTTAQLRSGVTNGPRDAGFRPAMLQLYSELIPTQNPERRPDDGPWLSR